MAKMNFPIKILRFLAVALIILSANTVDIHAQEIDLSGQWTVALDSADCGVSKEWYRQKFAGRITLPGTLLDAGLGRPTAVKPVMEKETFLHLAPRTEYVGVAWYQKTVHVPANWRGHEVELFLERVMWRSDVWVNGQKAEGFEQSLTTPHRFKVGALLTPGEDNNITIRIDNRKQHAMSANNLAHSYTNDTQTMWNGVLGRMTLKQRAKVWIGNVKLLPDAATGHLEALVTLEGDDKAIAKADVSLDISNPAGKSLGCARATPHGETVRLSCDVRDVQTWDEFAPRLYKAVITVVAGRQHDAVTQEFGFRSLSSEGAQLLINGRRLFLRGTLECCIFPLKGYPPTDETSWERVFTAAKRYGLNHIRLHSWCPPEAAFAVADRMGMYLQVELPVWELNVGEIHSTVEWLADEARRISQTYGHHPSFCFWSMGNELEGDFQTLAWLRDQLKSEDPRHLYTSTSFTFQENHGTWPEPGDDYWITQWTKKGWVRGQGVFDDETPAFDKDFQSSVDGLPVPLVTHEIGQYSVYPNLKEIDKYAGGNLLPVNFEAVRADLQRKGRLGKAEQFLLSSGKLAAILYKEEIERALKTPGISGFQLLDLHDFPGQGTALVGLLDAFWDSKGIVSDKEFRQFCSPVVPLARFAKATYWNDETFRVSFQLANFSAGELSDVQPEWSLKTEDGTVIKSGRLARTQAKVGNGIPLGSAEVELSGITEAHRLTLSLAMKGTDYRNEWPIWVYPRVRKADEDTNVLYTRSFSEAEEALKKGQTVLLNPDIEETNGLEGKFVQVFWSPVHFPNQAGTMGMYCNPAHPALSLFPTEDHSNWQWWELQKKAVTMELDSIAPGIEPIIGMVDNFFKNRNLGLAFECRVGEGRLLVCSSDLQTDLEQRPAAAQLRRSLLSYMNTNQFRPQQQIDFASIKSALFNSERKKQEKKNIYD